MNDEPRRRRAELLDELRRLNAELIQARSGDPASGGDPDWQPAVAAAPQFLLLLDDELRFRFVSRMRPGRKSPVGRSVFEFLPASYHAGLREAIDCTRATGLPQYFELTANGPDGEASWYSNWVVPMSDAKSPDGVAIIAVDVSHQTRTERALEDEKSVLASLVAHAPDHIVIVDREHRVQFRNRAETDRPDDQVLGYPIEDHFEPEFRPRVHDAIERVLGTAESCAFEVQIRAADGLRWYATRAGPVFRGTEVDRVSLISTDITGRVEQARIDAAQQTRLQQSEERFRTMVEHAPEAMVIYDADTGLFVDANDNACLLFGMSREQLLASRAEDVSPERQPDGTPSAEAARARVEQVLQGGHTVFEWVHNNAAGEPLASEVRLVRLPHPERRLLRGSVIDISERKRIEEEHQRLSQELIQSQKLQAIGQLTGGVAHDFNNLLTVIMSSVEMIESNPHDPVRVGVFARQAMTAAERGAELTQRLLAFARRQPLRPQAIDLNRLVADAEHLLRRTLDETITIGTLLADDLWSCETDPTQLENVILNLAINARDAMPQGGYLTLETANARLEGAYTQEHGEVQPGAYVMLAVSDNGSGMEPGVLRQVFEPFFTTKPAGHGSGLGLSMVYGFVKQSGGHVKIHSELGKGTTVRIYLPRSGANADAVRARRAPADTPTGNGRLVLVVEDDTEVRALVVEELRSLDYRTLDAADAPTALALLARTPGVDLVLSDVVLPGGINGTDLAKRAQRLQPGLPVLFMSGYTENAIIHNGRLDPGVALLEKPFTRRQLALAVCSVLDGQDDDT